MTANMGSKNETSRNTINLAHGSEHSLLSLTSCAPSVHNSLDTLLGNDEGKVEAGNIKLAHQVWICIHSLSMRFPRYNNASGDASYPGSIACTYSMS